MIDCGEYDENSCPQGCLWIEEGSCNDPAFSGCYATKDENENAGNCPSAIEGCRADTETGYSKSSCLEVGCSWCDGECRDPNAELNQECKELVLCRNVTNSESCPDGCDWIASDSNKCNDPTFLGCYAVSSEDKNAGFCPDPQESCPTSDTSTKENCLAADCSWCDGECRDPKAELNEECAELILCRNVTDADLCPDGCKWIDQESKKCNDPTFEGCYAVSSEDENAGECPGPQEPCLNVTESASKEECLDASCSWCDGECRDPDAKLNQECENLILCRNVTSSESCPEGCEWIDSESNKCNDPTFKGCYTESDENKNAGECPESRTPCASEASSKEECLQANCSWCNTECTDPNANVGNCDGNIRRQRVKKANKDEITRNECLEMGNKWCDNICLASKPRLLKPYDEV